MIRINRVCEVQQEYEQMFIKYEGNVAACKSAYLQMTDSEDLATMRADQDHWEGLFQEAIKGSREHYAGCDTCNPKDEQDDSGANT